MTAAAQLAMPVEAKLPLDPFELVDLAAIERGKLYNRLSPPLDSWQRQAVEEALRLVVAGAYPTCAGEVAVDAAEHLVRERIRCEALGRPVRGGRR